MIGNKNSPKDIPTQIKLNALPLLRLKNLLVATDAVCAINPWPDNLRKNIPIANKIIPLTNEKKSDARLKKIITKLSIQLKAGVEEKY